MEDDEGMNGILDIGLLTEQSDRRSFSCASLFFPWCFCFVWFSVRSRLTCPFFVSFWFV